MKVPSVPNAVLVVTKYPREGHCLKQAEQLKTAVRKAAWKAGGELQGQVTTGCAWGSVCRLEKELDMFMASEFINRC